MRSQPRPAERGFVKKLDIESFHTKKRRRRVKLIFNPKSGTVTASPVQLMDIIREMQAWKLMPEVFLLEPDSDIPAMVKDTLAQGIRLFVVCGGDGSIAAVAKSIAKLPATLGIIPTGTQNNIARALGIPKDIPQAIAILRTGNRVKTDVGMVTSGEEKTPFIEICSVGLMSSLFPSGDDIQHGHLEKIGDFLATLVNSAPSQIRLALEGKKEICATGHMVLISNMPYIGRHYQVGQLDAFKDGLLDVLLFGELSKIDLLGYAFKGTNIAEMEDARLRHFQVRKVEIDVSPSMPVMVDGVLIKEGPIQIEVQHRALAVMMPPAQMVKREPQENPAE